MTNESHTKTKQKRGRPTGASRYAESDRAILEKVADRLVREPGLVRTVLIRSYRVTRVGVSEESDIHRLNKNWRISEKELLADAKRRRDARANLGWLGELAGMVSLFSGWSERFLNSAAANDISGLFATVQEDVDAGLGQRAAHTEMGLSPKPPIDIDDTASVSAAIDRFEKRPFKTHKQLAESFDPSHTLNDLPQWQRYEVMSVMLHEMALEAKRRDDKTPDNSQHSINRTGDEKNEKDHNA